MKDRGSVREAESHTKAVRGCEKELERKKDRERNRGRYNNSLNVTKCFTFF